MKPRRSREVWAVTLAAAILAAPTVSARPQRVTEGFEPIASNIDARIKAGAIPGALAIISREDKIVYRYVAGYMDVASKTVLAEDAIFRWRSMTKPVIAVAILMLAEQGRLSIDDPVSKFIPSFENLRVFVRRENDRIITEPLRRPITIRHLLTHTSGFTYQPNGDTDVHRAYREQPHQMVIVQFPSLADAAHEAAKVPLMFQPGDGWEYGISIDVLGFVIEQAAGVDLATFLSERIFQPLGMSDTGFFVPHAKLHRFVTLYEATPDGLRCVETAATSAFRNPRRTPSGGGGLVGTAADYLRFAQMLANSGTLNGVRILQPQSVAMMATNQLDTRQAMPAWTNPHPGRGHGLGLAVDSDITRSGRTDTPGVMFWGGSAQTYFWIDVQRRLVGLWMSQAYLDPYSFEPLEFAAAITYAEMKQ